MKKKFSGNLEFLSNFYACNFILKGTSYKSSEHAYQSIKLKNKKDRKFVRKQEKAWMAKK